MNLKKSGFFVIIVYLLIIGQIFQVFKQITQIGTFWPSVILLMIYTIIYNPIAFLKNTNLRVFLLFFVIIIYDNADHLNNLPEVVLNPFGLFSMIFPFFILVLLLENLQVTNYNDEKVISNIGKFSTIIFIVSVAISLISEIKYPGISREKDKIILSTWAWSLSFGAIYSLPFLLMTFIALYKGKTSKLWLISILILGLLIAMGFLTALFLTMMALIVGLLFRFRKKKYYAVSIIVILIGLFSLSSLNTFIDYLPQLPNAIYQEKAKDLSVISQTRGTNNIIAGTRQGVYEASIRAIRKNPIFGTGDFNKVGQHSFWLDRFGFIGIFGTSFYIIVILGLFQKARKLLTDSENQFYKLMISLVIGLLFLNPIEWPDFWLVIFFLIPSIIVYLRRESKPIS